MAILNYLECFIAVAETLNFTKAGYRLKVAQPSISRQIKLLEEQLNTKLFIRDHHQVVLTEEGSKLKNRLKPLLQEVNLCLEDTKNRTEVIAGKVAFGCLTEVGQSTFMSLLLQFQKSYQNIQLMVSYLKEFEIVEGVKKGTLDFGVITSALVQENIRAYPLLKERVVLVSHPDMKVNIEQLIRYDFVVYRHLDPLLVSYLKRFYPSITYNRLNVKLAVNSHRSMVESLQSHPYLAVVPYLSVEKELSEGHLQLASQNEMISDLYLILHENQLMEKRKTLFRDFLLRQTQLLQKDWLDPRHVISWKANLKTSSE